MEAIVLLEDGRVFEGSSFGAEGERAGEVVFNTSMTGYQEILTDPSYKGQIVTMTYPHIGNYGVNTQDVESGGPKVEGFIVKELSRRVSNWRSSESLGQYLSDNDIVGVEGIDTRALTKHIRTAGAMKCIISTIDFDIDSLNEKMMRVPSMQGSDLVKEVTCKKAYDWEYDGVESRWYNQHRSDERYKVAAIDFGIKTNIIRMLSWQGCKVRVFPAGATGSEILDWGPDGIFLSNGPGDPAAVTYGVENVRELIGKQPIFGICLGHQILGLALGSKTYKLK
ncbi:MAG: glutamine-hydrolyzing carbamoyl-phosphate synthase small subunit, partial [Halobacteriota archaeon]|nr:glutamine-hydrolyzing carbamoyl-phosphate synthase small subunit [Halobacteriota archaeon]